MIIFIYEIINVNKVIRERYKDLQEDKSENRLSKKWLRLDT